jgi:hypothetical protein
MPTTSLEKSITIPMKLLNEAGDEGLVVLPLAKGAYFVIRADVFATYPRQRLASIRRVAKALQEAETNLEGKVPCTPRKQRGLDELAQRGFAVSDGSGYRLQEQLLPSVPLDLVRQSLASMKGTLSQEVIEERGKALSPQNTNLL